MPTIRFTRTSCLSFITEPILISKCGRLYSTTTGEPRTILQSHTFGKNVKYQRIPRGYWNEISNQRKFFDHLGTQIGIQSLDEWYERLSTNLLVKNSGTGILKKYNSSSVAALMAAYPEHHWIPWKFNCTQGFWKSVDNQRKYFDWLGKEIGIQTLDDWYEKAKNEVIYAYGGRTLLIKYKYSLQAALMAAYPEHNWAPWKFHSVSRGFWKSKENVATFLNELSEKLSITTLDDWYRVDRTQLTTFGGASLLLRYQGLYNLLKEQYPHHPWDPKRFKQSGKKTQRWLVIVLKKMFPNEEVLEDYVHPRVTLSSSDRPMQLDVFIPSRSLAFEFQGKQHFEDIGVFNPSRTYQQRDEEKRALCAANNVKLIEVPYWWNRTREELEEMITKAG